MTEFTDAQLMRIENPDTFDAPCKEGLDAIKEGDSVKVCNEGERFWVTVTKIEDQKITGTVDNDLVRSEMHGLNYGDEISFEKRHIYSIYG